MICYSSLHLEPPFRTWPPLFHVETELPSRNIKLPVTTYLHGPFLSGGVQANPPRSGSNSCEDAYHLEILHPSPPAANRTRRLDR